MFEPNTFLYVFFLFCILMHEVPTEVIWTSSLVVRFHVFAFILSKLPKKTTNQFKIDRNPIFQPQSITKIAVPAYKYIMKTLKTECRSSEKQSKLPHFTIPSWKLQIKFIQTKIINNVNYELCDKLSLTNLGVVK